MPPCCLCQDPPLKLPFGACLPTIPYPLREYQCWMVSSSAFHPDHSLGSEGWEGFKGSASLHNILLMFVLCLISQLLLISLLFSCASLLGLVPLL